MLRGRNVHNARLDTAGKREGGEAEIDRDAAALLFFPAIGIDAGERLDERRLAVVDMSRVPTTNEWTHARRSQMSMALDFGSLPFRPVSSR